MDAGKTAERIESLDVLRGFALLGILVVNSVYFAAPWEAAINPLRPPLGIDAASLWSWLIPHVFFEFKCITLFSMLFGISLYLVGGERDDAERGVYLRRRLLWLLLFGVVHATLIWFGDILIVYALTGLLVMLARSWRAPMLLSVGILLVALATLITIGSGAALGLIPASKIADIEAMYWSLPAENVQRIIASYTSGPLGAARENIEDWLTFASGALIMLMLRTAGVMMIGLALFKWGVLSGRAPLWVYVLLALVGAGALAVIFYQALINWRLGFPFAHMQGPGIFANTALSPLVTLGYASVLILLVRAGARWITAPLAAVGRMAFTNYIAQSLIMTTIFWGRGFGLMGEVTRPELMGIVGAVWVAQLLWSPLWLSRFRMGPLEWVWRSLTYGRAVAMTLPKPSAAG